MEVTPPGVAALEEDAAPPPHRIHSRSRGSGWVWILAGIGGAIGLVAASLHRSPLLALGGAAGLVVVGLALARPPVALVLLQVVTWSNISSVAGSHGGISLYLVAIAVAVLSVAIEARRRKQLRFGRSPLYRLLALVFAAEGLSLIFSTHRLSLTLTTSQLKDLVFFACTVALISFTGKPATAVKAMATTIAVLCGLTLVQQYGLHNATTFGGLSQLHAADIGAATSRHTGPESDPNFWGRTIVLVTPLALSLLLVRIRARRRWWPWALAVTALAGGEYLSQSRGGLIAFAIELLIWILVALWDHRRWLWLVPAAALVLFTLVPSLASRLSTVGQLAHISVGTTDPSLIDRVQVQEVGMAIFRHHPVTGVGLGNFEVVEPSYLGTPGITDTGSVFAPHDLYLQIASEQGLIGLGAWLLFYGGAIVIATRAYILGRRLQRDDDALLALGAVAGLVGWAAASAVLHLSDLNELLAVVAIVAVLDRGLRQRMAAEPVTYQSGPSVLELSQRRMGRRAAALSVGSVALMGAVAVAAVSVYLPLTRPAWQAKATFGVRPEPAASSGNDAYAWDVINRQSLIPTLVAIISNRRFTGDARGAFGPPAHGPITFAASGSSAAAVLTLSVTAPDPVAARRVAGVALAGARDYISGLIGIYEVDQVSTWPATQVAQPNPTGEWALAGTIGATCIAALALSSLSRRRILLRSTPR